MARPLTTKLAITTNPKSRNFGLDAVRAAAILLVLVSHGSKYLPPDITTGNTSLFWSLGVLGVEIFYALSGFLIGGILLEIQAAGASWQSIKTFLIRRWMRTLPLYYLVLILLLSFPILDPEFQSDIWTYFVMGQNLMSPMPMGSWFGPSWSLTIEEWSYLVLPILAFGFFRGRYSVASASAVLIVLGLLWRLLLTSEMEPWDETIRKVVITRIDAIAFGVLLAYLQQSIGTVKLKAWAKWLSPVWLSIIALTMTICINRYDPPYYLQGFYGRVLMLPLAGLALAGLLPLTTGWAAAKVIEAPIKLIARLSYALYLVHWPFLFILDGVVPEPYAFTVFLLSTLTAAAVLSFAVEQPIMRLRPKTSQTAP